MCLSQVVKDSPCFGARDWWLPLPGAAPAVISYTDLAGASLGSTIYTESFALPLSQGLKGSWMDDCSSPDVPLSSVLYNPLNLDMFSFT